VLLDGVVGDGLEPESLDDPLVPVPVPALLDPLGVAVLPAAVEAPVDAASPEPAGVSAFLLLLEE
jgi:hypothetical protein